jgi:hypothetical protein
MAGLCEHRRELVDEALRHGMAGTRAADDDRGAVADLLDGLAN